MGKPEVKRPLGRPRLRWEDNIKMDLEEVAYGCMDWIELAQNRDRCRVFINRTFGFRRMRVISCLAENPLVSQGKLCSME